jgi:hypothetical protein
MSQKPELPKPEESKNPKELYYSEVIESLRKRFAEHYPNFRVADRPSPSKETIIEVTFIKRKNFPKP